MPLVFGVVSLLSTDPRGLEESLLGNHSAGVLMRKSRSCGSSTLNDVLFLVGDMICGLDDGSGE